MLTELRIENFAIIDHLEMNFDTGLVVLTGETGAGKSIILDALETILGGRADNTLIRSGIERASVEASFRISETVRQPVHEILKNEELLDDPDYVTLGREIRRNGRNIARVNGRTVGVSLLKELGEYLVDIHGQSEHLSLLRVRQHIGLLDRYADIDQLLLPYQETFKRLQDTRRELTALRQSERDTAQRVDLLIYQIEEIETARLRPGEEDELREERNRLANAEGLASLSQEALQLLDEGTPENPAISDLLGQVVTTLTNLAKVDPSKTELTGQITTLFESLTDLNLNLRDYLEKLEFNPKRLEQVEERLGLLHSLKRKYGETLPVVLEFAETARKELESITNAEERIQELEAEQEQLLTQLAVQGMALSKARHSAAAKLEKAIENELEDLRMRGARFRVDFQRTPNPQGISLSDGDRLAFDSTGFERIEFLIESNPGEGFKPLVKIASGGETSRLMLALKNVLARADRVPTLVFDEIDQGIGGRVGTMVGHKLWLLTNQHQVMVITHLPQLAAFGEQHFQVQKQIQGGRTITLVEHIDGEARLNELAQMLGEVSVGTLRSAQEILQTANGLKKK